MSCRRQLKFLGFIHTFIIPEVFLLYFRDALATSEQRLATPGTDVSKDKALYCKLVLP